MRLSIGVKIFSGGLKIEFPNGANCDIIMKWWHLNGREDPSTNLCLINSYLAAISHKTAKQRLNYESL